MKNIGWKAYLVFFCILSWGNLGLLFSAESEPYIFYHILGAFHKPTFIFYGLNLCEALLSISAVVPLFLFICNRRLLPIRFWRWHFFLRLIFDLTGRYYEFVFLKSLLYDELHLGLAFIAAQVFLLFPSYLLHFKYAFRQES